MTLPQIKDGVLACIAQIGLGEDVLPVFGKTDPEPDWYVHEKNGMYANTHVTHYNHPHMVPIFHESELAGSVEACVRIVAMDILKHHAMDYAVTHTAPDRDPKRLYYPKFKELLRQVHPAWVPFADWMRHYDLYRYGYDDAVTARNEYRKHILDNGQVEVFARSKLHIRDRKHEIEPYLIQQYANDLAFERFPAMKDHDGVEMPPPTQSKVPQEFKDRVKNFGGALVSPDHGLPSYDVPKDGWFINSYHIEYINDVYHYVCMGERGEESRRSTANADEFFRWIFRDASPRIRAEVPAVDIAQGKPEDYRQRFQAYADILGWRDPMPYENPHKEERHFAEYVDGIYRYGFSERGSDHLWAETRNLEEFLFQVFFHMTQFKTDYDADDDPNEDRRIFAFPRQMALMQKLDPKWAERTRALQQIELSNYPMKDVNMAREEYRQQVLYNGEAEKMARTMRVEESDEPVSQQKIEYWAEKLVKERYPNK